MKTECPMCQKLDTTKSDLCRWCMVKLNAYDNFVMESQVDPNPIQMDHTPVPGWVRVDDPCEAPY
jgi:hypothetical protein